MEEAPQHTANKEDVPETVDTSKRKFLNLLGKGVAGLAVGGASALIPGKANSLEDQQVQGLHLKVKEYRVQAIGLLGAQASSLFIMPNIITTGPEKGMYGKTLYVLFKDKGTGWMRGTLDGEGVFTERMKTINFPSVKKAIEEALKSGKGFFPVLKEDIEYWSPK